MGRRIVFAAPFAYIHRFWEGRAFAEELLDLGDDLSMFKKGLVLVAVPLLVPILAMLFLWYMQTRSLVAQHWLLHTKEVIARADRTHRFLSEAHSNMRALIVTGDLEFASRYRELVEKVPPEFEKLSVLIRDNPQQLERVQKLQTQTAALKTWLDSTVANVEAGQLEEAIANVRSRVGAKMLDRIGEDFDRFLDTEAGFDQERQATLRQSDAFQLRAIAGVALLCLFVTALALSAFHRGVTRRLSVLAENARRLAAGTPLAPPIGGRDEIGVVDVAYHSAAQTLAEREEENEMFVYSVSHDLRAPLVNLEGFAKELALTAKDATDAIAAAELPDPLQSRLKFLLQEEMGEYIGFIETATGRLSAIIDSLLRLSRAGRVEYRWQEVDVRATVSRVAKSFGKTVEQKHAAIAISGDIPPAWGDQTALEQVFANLVQNALAYLDVQREGRIEIGSLSTTGNPGFNTYFVRDNGLGIPDAYREKLFLAFQRFHPDAAQGEGVGLALVRRTIERHGGNIRVDSRVNEGSTFYVTLPSRPPEGIAPSRSQQIYGQGEPSA